MSTKGAKEGQSPVRKDRDGLKSPDHSKLAQALAPPKSPPAPVTDRYAVLMDLHDDIQSPRLLKLKGLLFGVLAAMAAAGVLIEPVRWRRTVLLALCMWASCRTYYFVFYVLHHYAGAGAYAGLWDAWRKRKKR